MASHADFAEPHSQKGPTMSGIRSITPVRPIAPPPEVLSRAQTYLNDADTALGLAEVALGDRRRYFVQVAAVYGDMARCAQLRDTETVAEILQRADQVLALMVAAELTSTDAEELEPRSARAVLAGLELADELLRHATQTDDLSQSEVV
jgi:predicted RNase H-like HicB family nuclease